MTERSIKVRLEAEISQYKKALDDAAQATERLGATQDLAAKKVDAAAAAQKNAADKVKAAEETLKKVRSDSTSTAEQQSKAEKDLTRAKLDETQASQTLRDAERGLTEAKLASAEATLKQETRMGRFTGFMEKNAAGVQAAGTMMVAFGGAITGVGLAAAKTGIEYNTLQQTTRKALTTLTGSAKAANDQMDKLDAFARTSPFAKGTFIQSQQQMIAFGIETNKVIPYLSALNDAVAAAGGNSQTIGELSMIMSQISASSKITATDLMQFGTRGVDAATLIGSQMNMTGTEIRESITAGTLDATDALDALAAGMSETYAGAAAGVKDTFAGAIDRMKASWREFGAMLAEPLVSQSGGGMLVDLANKVADVGNAFRNLPEPLRNTTLGIMGVLGVGSLLAGTFALAAPRLIATHAALTTMVGPRIVGGLTGLAKGAGAAGVAIAALYALNKWTGYDVVEGDISEMTSAVLDLADGSKNAEGALDELFFMESRLTPWKIWEEQTAGVEGFSHALRQLADPTFAEKAGKTLSWLPFFNADGFKQASSDVESLDASLAQLVASGNSEAAERAWAEMVITADELGLSTEELTEMFPGYAAALKEVENQTRLVTEATEEFDTTTLEENLNSAAEAADKYAREWQQAIMDTASASTSLLGAFDEVADKGTVTAKKLLGTLQKNAEDYEKWSGNIVKIQQRLTDTLPAEMQAAGVAMVQELVDAGPESAKAAALLVGMTEDELKKAVESSAGFGAEAGKQFAQKLDEARVPELQVGTTEATRTTERLLAIIDATGGRLKDWKLDAENSRAINKADGTVIAINQKTSEIKITGQNSGALNKALQAQRDINNMSATITVTARVATSSVNVGGTRLTVSARADGGRAPVGAGLRAFAGGGRLPSTGLGTDQILGINSMGLPTAWVDDREWVINSRSSDKYDNLLNAINQDSPSVQGLAGYAGGGVTAAIPAGVSVGTNAGFDYTKLAAAIRAQGPTSVDLSDASLRDVRNAIRGGSAEGSAAGTRDGLAGAGSGVSTLVRAH